MFDSGFPFLPPGKTKSSSRIACICLRMLSAAAESAPGVRVRLSRAPLGRPKSSPRDRPRPTERQSLRRYGRRENQELEHTRRDAFLNPKLCEKVGDLVIGQRGVMPAPGKLPRAFGNDRASTSNPAAVGMLITEQRPQPFDRGRSIDGAEIDNSSPLLFGPPAAAAQKGSPLFGKMLLALLR